MKSEEQTDSSLTAFRGRYEEARGEPGRQEARAFSTIVKEKDACAPEPSPQKAAAAAAMPKFSIYLGMTVKVTYIALHASIGGLFSCFL